MNGHEFTAKDLKREMDSGHYDAMAKSIMDEEDKRVIEEVLLEASKIKKYRISGSLVLWFIEDREQVDYVLDYNTRGYLECDGTTVWFVGPRGRIKSTTTASAIAYGVESGNLQQFFPEGKQEGKVEK